MDLTTGSGHFNPRFRLGNRGLNSLRMRVLIPTEPLSVYMSTSSPYSKDRRNVSLDHELNEWLREEHHGHASELIEELLMAYRAYGGEKEAVQYVAEKRAQEPRERR